MTPRRNFPQGDSLDVAAFDYRWTPAFVNGLADPGEMEKEFRELLPRLGPGEAWGWKCNPSAHLLPFYSGIFPDLRFIHIIRDGSDMAIRPAGGHVHTRRLGRAVLDGDPSPIPFDDMAWRGHATTRAGDPEATPARKAAFWAKVNSETADFGELALRERYMRVRLEDAVADPGSTVSRIARFLGVDEAPPSAATSLQRPATMGCGRAADLGTASNLMHGALARFGYTTDPD